VDNQWIKYASIAFLFFVGALISVWLIFAYYDDYIGLVQAWRDSLGNFMTLAVGTPAIAGLGAALIFLKGMDKWVEIAIKRYDLGKRKGLLIEIANATAALDKNSHYTIEEKDWNLVADLMLTGVVVVGEFKKNEESSESEMGARLKVAL
jgi:hypothetical protein